MAVLTQNYNPMIYENIPQFDNAVKRVNSLEQGIKFYLDQLGQVFVKHQTYSKYGLLIIHRHFDMARNEVLVETKNSDKSMSLSMPWSIEGVHVKPSDPEYWKSHSLPLQKFVVPRTWEFDDQGQLQPFEFQAVDNHVAVEPPLEFVADLYKELKSLGLEKILGLQTQNPKSWESTPAGVRANILHYGETPKEIKSGMITVAWTFNENGKTSANGDCRHQCCGHGGGCGCHN